MNTYSIRDRISVPTSINYQHHTMYVPHMDGDQQGHIYTGDTGLTGLFDVQGHIIFNGTSRITTPLQYEREKQALLEGQGDPHFTNKTVEISFVEPDKLDENKITKVGPNVLYKIDFVHDKPHPKPYPTRMELDEPVDSIEGFGQLKNNNSLYLVILVVLSLFYVLIRKI